MFHTRKVTAKEAFECQAACARAQADYMWWLRRATASKIHFREAQK